MYITMLGTSGSGKTSYLSAISGLFCHGNYDNYTLQPKSKDLKAHTMLNSQLARIDTLYTKFQFPDGTASTTKLELLLYHRYNEVVDVNWIDYRGGDVDKLAKGEIEPEKSELYAAILHSDAVMVFVDASLIKAWGNGNLPALRYKIGANYIEPLLEHAVRRKTINIVFVLSKSDSANIDLSKDENMLKDKVRKIYSRFFDGIGGGFSKYDIIPIGVVGLNNTTIEMVDTNGFPIKHGIVDFRKMETYHVASSFAQTLLLCLKTAKRTTESEARSLASELKRLEQDLDTTFRHIIDLLFYNGKKRNEIFEIKQKIMENKYEILRLSGHEEGLRNMANSSL
jgi:hypothetical protein